MTLINGYLDAMAQSYAANDFLSFGILALGLACPVTSWVLFVVMLVRK